MWGRSHRDDDADEERASLLGAGGTTSYERAAAAAQGLKSWGSTRLGLAAAPPPPPPPGCCPELSYTTRLTGFAFCFVLGCLLSLTSMGSFPRLLLGNPLPFAFKYTLGNILSICSYGFLVGPQRQCAGLFAVERRYATLLFLGSLVATMYCVFHLQSYTLTMICIIVQFLSMVYCACDCPRARAAADARARWSPPPFALTARAPSSLSSTRRRHELLALRTGLDAVRTAAAPAILTFTPRRGP